MVEAAHPGQWNDDGSEFRRLLGAQRDERILVAIAADSAAVAGAAVSEAIDRAVRPDRVRVSVAVPADRSSDPALDGWRGDPRVTIEQVPVRHATEGEAAGATMAPLRSAARRRYDGEPSVVLVDGPVRFASGWDEWATDILQLADADRPVIDLAVSTSATAHVAAVDSPTDTEPEQAVRRGLVDVVAPGRLCADTPIDDEDHDGSRLALRAYTHGYDCFATDAVLVWKPAQRDDGTGVDRANDDLSQPEPIDGLGERRTVDAFRRLLAWSECVDDEG